MVALFESDGALRQAGRWRRTNVPVSEPHIVALVVGAGLHVRRPWHLSAHPRAAAALGWTVTGLGVALVAAAVGAAGSVDVERPTTLVTGGPYAFSRNPMYVGWTVLYAGIALIANTAWLLVALPFVVATTHAVVGREERALEREFGEEYRAYRRAVRRYL